MLCSRFYTSFHIYWWIAIAETAEFSLPLAHSMYSSIFIQLKILQNQFIEKKKKIQVLCCVTKFAGSICSMQYANKQKTTFFKCSTYFNKVLWYKWKLIWINLHILQSITLIFCIIFPEIYYSYFIMLQTSYFANIIQSVIIHYGWFSKAYCIYDTRSLHSLQWNICR